MYNVRKRDPINCLYSFNIVLTIFLVCTTSFSANCCYYCREFLYHLKALHKIMALFLIVAILISTTGFTVYEHRCSHTGNVIISLIDEHSQCCEHEHAELQSSCCSNISECPSGKSSNCCEESIKTYKLETPLSISKQETEKQVKFEKIFEFSFDLKIILDLEEVRFSFVEDIIVHENSPPLFILFNQLKIMSSDLQTV